MGMARVNIDSTKKNDGVGKERNRTVLIFGEQEYTKHNVLH